MKKITAIFFFTWSLIPLILSCSDSESFHAKNSHDCKCDSTRVKEIILAKEYRILSKYDTPSFAPDSLYFLSSKENRLLWFRDIESPDTTKFTRYWNDYEPNNYHASNADFIKYYESDPATEMAFQFGPGGMMWTYHSFVIKKIECCYVITRSAFTHARFRYKAYAILDNSDMERIRDVFKPFEKTSIPSREEYGYHGHFIDRQNSKQFFIDFEKQVDAKNEPTKEIMKLYNFVDDSIKWNVTYNL